MRTVSVIALLLAPPLAAHDVWIEPSTFHGAAEPVTLSLRIGEPFAGGPTSSVAARAPFEARSADRSLRVVPLPGDGSTALLEPPAGGPVAIGYRSTPREVEMTAARFTRYLRAEGLEPPVDLRRRGAPAVRERYSRSLKTVLACGGGGDGPPLLGLPLELTARPTSAGRVKGEWEIRLWFRGEPLSGVRVSAMPLADRSAARHGTTDADGRWLLAIDHAGGWLVKALHLREATTPTADWRSWWASLTFGVAGDGRRDHC